MQLPSREACYLESTTDLLTYSFPGGHRVWETAWGKVNQYATVVASKPLGMPSTREHKSVYSESDPMGEDEDDPYALPLEEEEREDLTQVPDIDVVRRHLQAGDSDIVGPAGQTRLQVRVAGFRSIYTEQYQGTPCE